MASTWESMKFNVIPYLKGTQERGFILGTVEEILLTMDNDAMNLQSMAGSRFVGPFLASIQQWEKYLSLISETIEVSKSGRITDNQTDQLKSCLIAFFAQVWMLVQRKWMYLESIFIGGDIRSQLPTEAKKFDKLDQQFKDVSISILATCKSKVILRMSQNNITVFFLYLDNE